MIFFRPKNDQPPGRSLKIMLGESKYEFAMQEEKEGKSVILVNDACGTFIELFDQWGELNGGKRLVGDDGIPIDSYFQSISPYIWSSLHLLKSNHFTSPKCVDSVKTLLGICMKVFRDCIRKWAETVRNFNIIPCIKLVSTSEMISRLCTIHHIVSEWLSFYKELNYAEIGEFFEVCNALEGIFLLVKEFHYSDYEMHLKEFVRNLLGIYTE